MAEAAITPEPPFVKDTWMTDENLFTAVYSLANGQLFASIGFETMQEMAGALSDMSFLLQTLMELVSVSQLTACVHEFFAIFGLHEATMEQHI